ncbi:MAG: serine/threonine-protein kinase [Chthoniobacterales bacterium]
MSELEAPQPILQACSACGALLDVSDETPYAQIYCPSCGQGLRARTQFNNFTLQELLGEGGMGSVLKAMDLNLQRMVALKILKKECSANAEERQRLETEARITASINHPNVVKVFSFGEDHGQFYLAMELVEKGSLDDLMTIQRRVSEAQVLEVGIQIAQGLEAAAERGLIHRDVKPGNILFADAHTAKIVDFGLALAMADEAAARGEVWGTPYYIAPEKLNNEPEDFRSDMYSLGGTLFHALAGRPPFEAQSASLVALKHIKSQAVSLQAFAPDVSSETAYVINRTLHKDPNQRYASYAELVEHLSYARAKLLERAQNPKRQKERVVVESKEQQTVTGILTMGVLLVLVIAGILLFVFRDRVFGKGTNSSDAPAVALTAEQVNQGVAKGKTLLFGKKYTDALEQYQSMMASTGISQPMLDWIRLNESLAAILAGQPGLAKQTFDLLQQEGLYSSDEDQHQLANFFIEVARNMATEKPVGEGIIPLYSPANYEAFGLLLFGIKDFQSGDFETSKKILQAFVLSEPKAPYAWISEYKAFARLYIDDIDSYLKLSAKLPSVQEAIAAEALMKEVKAVEAKLQTGEKLKVKFEALRQDLVGRGAQP